MVLYIVQPISKNSKSHDDYGEFSIARKNLINILSPKVFFLEFVCI